MSRALCLSALLLPALIVLLGCTVPDGDSSSHHVDDELKRAGILSYQDDSSPVTGKATPAQESVVTEDTPVPEPEIQIVRSDAPRPKKVTKTAMPDGLEILPLWKSVDWGIPCTISHESTSSSGGEGKGLRVRLDPSQNKPDKATDKMGIVLLRPKPGSSATQRNISLNIRYSGLRGVMLSAAVQVGQSYEYFESKPVLLKSGWNRGISFDLNTKSWKSEKTGWKFETQVPAGPVGKLFILVYEPPADLDILIDSLHFP